MDIPVLLEPTETGWRATTGGPLNLTADAATRDAALAELRRQIVLSYASGKRIVPLTVPEPHPLLDLVAKTAASPFADEWLEIMRQVREDSGYYDPDVPLFPEDVSPAERNGHVPSASDAAQPTRS